MAVFLYPLHDVHEKLKMMWLAPTEAGSTNPHQFMLVTIRTQSKQANASTRELRKRFWR